MKAFEKNKEYIYTFILTIIAYFPMLFFHLGTDSYLNYIELDAKAPLSSGRIVFYLYIRACEYIELNPVKYQILFIAIFIILSVYVMKSMFELINAKYNTKNNKLISMLTFFCIMLSFINVFYLEWFLFPETCFIYGLSMLFLLFAIKSTVKKKLMYAFIYLLLSFNCYQATFPIYIIFMSGYMLLENNFKFNKKSMKDTVEYLIVAAIASLFQLLEIKMLKMKMTTRGDFEIDTLTDKIEILFFKQSDLWHSAFGFMPEWFLQIVLCICLAFILIGVKKRKIRICDIVYSVTVVLGSYISIFVLSLFSSSIWLAPRTIVAFFFFISMLFLLAIYLNRENQKRLELLVVVLLVFLSINYIKITDVSINHHKSLALNEIYSVMVDDKINQYEMENGIEVKYIAIANDSNPSYGYPGIEYTIFDTNLKAFSVPWAAVPCLNYYTNNNYIQIAFPKSAFKYFDNNLEWNSFDLDEQLKIINDTAFLINY